MPQERFTSTDKYAWADLSVTWPQQDELTDHYIDGNHIAADKPHVSLTPVAPERHPGGIYFRPDNPEDIGLEPGSHGGVGPVPIDFDRTGINRLITVLRQARDEAFGADA